MSEKIKSIIASQLNISEDQVTLRMISVQIHLTFLRW